MKELVRTVLVAIVVFGVLFLMGYGCPQKKYFTGLDGEGYCEVTKNHIFKHQEHYYEDSKGNIVDDRLAVAISMNRNCSCCGEYITKGYIKLGNEFFCSDECYGKYKRAIARIVGE